MIVNDMRNEDHTVTADMMLSGEVFYYDGRYFLMTRNLNGTSAVNLETGEELTFHPSAEVTRLHAEVKVFE